MFSRPRWWAPAVLIGLALVTAATTAVPADAGPPVLAAVVTSSGFESPPSTWIGNGPGPWLGRDTDVRTGDGAPDPRTVPPRFSGPVSTATPWVPRTITVLGAGDILLHNSLWAQGRRDAHGTGYDFDPIFASATPDIESADLAICHMETPYGPAAGPFTGYPVFQVPPQIAKTIHDIGYDSCSTASNHSLDGGPAGIRRTLDALDAAGVAHTGTARSAAEAQRVDLLDANGVRVAQLSYTFGFNGLRREHDWDANLIDADAILAAAHRARLAGAEVVILSLHWGTEYSPAPNDMQLALAKKLLASPDIDLILGCHAHVVQPIREIGGKWVAFGMGNQVATQGFSLPTQDGVMPRFTFTETTPGHFAVTRAEAIPTFMYLGSPARLIDLPRELARTDLPADRRALYEASWRRTAAVVRTAGLEIR